MHPLIQQPAPPNWHLLPEVQTAMQSGTHVLAYYQLELPTEKASQLPAMAYKVANGQTIGTQNADEIARLTAYTATVVWCSPPTPLPEASEWVRGCFVLGFPVGLVQQDLGALQTVLFGKISMGGRIRWQDVWIPPALAKRWQGASFGTQGIRHLVQAKPDSTLLMAIFKPCLGETPATLAESLYQQAITGTHLVKDDEILSDASMDAGLQRLEACLGALEKAKTETGKTPLYAFNLNGPAHELLLRAERYLAAGATAFLFNYLAYGLPMLQALATQLSQKIPIIAHPALGGAFYGSTSHGLSPALVFGTLPRLAGADACLFPSPYGSVCLPMADALAVQRALLCEHSGLKPVFPVPSAGIVATMVPAILGDFGRDVIINAGTGIMEAEGGAVAGATAFLSQL
ncbi:MAG: RuBisCO large subunit C-terminal-like domain-containing protein [Candidatus Melainabacteria bacterium]|nr:RuBisCO large subunit C-terminal-like domain-containing protein [Candidatus Melainabacteria bacterium]